MGKKRCMAECEQTREEWTVSPPYVPLLLCRQGSNLPCARPPAVLPTPRIPMRKKGRATSVKRHWFILFLCTVFHPSRLFKMFLQIWPLLSYFICATTSLVLNSGVLINLDAPVSGVTRLESPTATTSSTWAPVCDANLYGTPPLAGCREAVAKLRNYGEGAIVPYRQRGSPLFPGVLSLPARYSSCNFDFGLIRYDWLFIRLTAC